MADNLKNILIKYWGYPNFRPPQEEIIQSVMEGRDTLALMPTGGGKSLCFQVPTMAMEGLCLVVTPLIALMKDQVRNLTRKGIKAAAIYAGMNQHEIGMIYDNCAYGDVRFLYLSPERLQTDRFRLVFQKMKPCLIAVDEAHCISQWGYDFRPPYLKIAEIRSFHPGVPILALTATATPEVVDDIQDKLGFQSENVFRKSFERKNLTYLVIREQDKLGRMVRILNKVPGPAIVYVRNRKKTEEVAGYLNKNRIRADFYHAGLDLKLREKKQDGWMHEEHRVIVATNAFGMGIDKPNVRLVIHLDIPDSLEAYFQEAGRAGRDEKRSYAVILYQEADTLKIREQLNQEFPGLDVIKRIYQSLGNQLQLPEGGGKEEGFDLDLSDLAARSGQRPVIVHNALKFLEKEGYIQMNEAFEIPSKIFVTTSREDLYRFQVENSKYDPLIKLLLRSYAGLFNDFVIINEAELAKRAGMGKAELIRMLTYLDSMKVVEYAGQKEKPQVVFIRERMDARNIQLSPETYKTRKEIATEKIRAIIEYVQSDNECRSLRLLAYFGEKGVARCGRCDVCRQLNRVALSDYEFNQIQEKIKNILKDKPATLPEIVDMLDEHGEESVLKVIRWLQDRNLVSRDTSMKYFLRKQFRIKF